jgi:hypothetical protein
LTVTLSDDRPSVGEAIALKLEYCHTRLALPAEATVVCNRFARACTELGGDAEIADGRVRFRLG